MLKFLKNTGLFTLIFFILITTLVYSSSLIAKNRFDFKINTNKSILILGNSHPEHAIDDKKLKKVFNLAQSGTAYFYDYLKLRQILRNNQHIDTLVLSYGYGDIHKQRDSWFESANSIKHKFKNYFFLFEFNDYADIFKANPKDVLLYTPQTIFQNSLRTSIGYEGLGGFLRTDLNELQKSKENQSDFYRDINDGFSNYQTKYLLKIYELCKTNDMQLVLLNTPIHPVLHNIQAPLKSQYCSFAEKNLPEALLIDHSNTAIPDEGFRDLDHLNTIGAELYTSLLILNKFNLGLETCHFNNEY